eukprot:TRINITY_DN46875_c0_g1_i1.p1 TRINITY_DN46875_c0_g1~~TRINITY_DN46875_c0_g1_i1.p1  ORF type:complete len:1044 (+),score=290.51 TRINITY_DN46875_c0_g1_i1:59-3190(+)
MPEYDIDGVPVEFPFEAYPSQLAYMREVIRALDTGSNALLESPTGTGKTLCLLCATLAWTLNRGTLPQQDELVPPRPPRILYTSRTHAQLRQVVAEFRRTAYAQMRESTDDDFVGDFVVTAAALASRDQLCVHRSAAGTTGAQRNSVCAALRAGHQAEKARTKCHFYNNVHGFVKRGGLRSLRRGQDDGEGPGEDFSGLWVETTKRRPVAVERQKKVPSDASVLDIEELAEVGRDHGFCPFYFARQTSRTASIVFAPYNYVVSPATRRALGLETAGCVVIFDEGHNLAQVAADASSREVTTTELARARTEVRNAVRLNAEEAADPEEEGDGLKLTEAVADIVENTLLRIEEHMAATLSDRKGESLVKPGGEVRNFLRAAHPGLTPSTVGMLIEHIDLCVLVSARGVLRSGVASTTPGLESVRAFLACALAADDVKVHQADLSERYRMVVTADAGQGRKQQAPPVDGPEVRLGLWCMDASMALSHIGDVRCMIVTSGTLSPMVFSAADLGIPFEVRCANSHVIGPDQALAAVVARGPGGVSMDSRYQNRTSVDYLEDSGRAVLEVLRATPAGVLVFFGSFAFMRSSVAAWKADPDLWQSIEAAKRVFEEPSRATESLSVVGEYCATIDRGIGAVLFAVCRGKISEGVDFSDRHARAVVVVGLPFANRGDLKVQCKIGYVNDRRESTFLTGEEWYLHDAMRAVNQAVGRVIRHRQDYGAVLLLDSRFAGEQCTSSLAKWVQAAVDSDAGKSFEAARRRLQSFFRSHLGRACPAAGAPAVAAVQKARKAEPDEERPAMGAEQIAQAFARARAAAAKRTAPKATTGADAVLGLGEGCGKRRRVTSPPPEVAAGKRPLLRLPERPVEPPPEQGTGLLGLMLRRAGSGLPPRLAAAATPAQPVPSSAGAGAAVTGPQPAGAIAGTLRPAAASTTAPPSAARPAAGGSANSAAGARAASQAVFAALPTSCRSEWQGKLRRLAELCRSAPASPAAVTSGPAAFVRDDLVPWLVARLGRRPDAHSLLRDKHAMMIPAPLRQAYTDALTAAAP